MAELGGDSGTLVTKFDDETTYWSKPDRRLSYKLITISTAVLFLIDGPIQIVRFIRRTRWDKQVCTS